MLQLTIKSRSIWGGNSMCMNINCRILALCWWGLFDNFLGFLCPWQTPFPSPHRVPLPGSDWSSDQGPYLSRVRSPAARTSLPLTAATRSELILFSSAHRPADWIALPACSASAPAGAHLKGAMSIYCVKRETEAVLSKCRGFGDFSYKKSKFAWEVGY